MMGNVFKQQADITEHPNLNNFDGFFQNHMTMKAGYLYPFMCKPTVPGDVFRINTSFGIKAMPLNFPIQSTLKAKVAYVYVPNRILMDDYKDMMAGVDKENGDTIVHPYISQASNPDFFKTGSLADYLDIPTTVISSTSSQVMFPTDGATSMGQSVGFSADFDEELQPIGTSARMQTTHSHVDALCWMLHTSDVYYGITMADVACQPTYSGVRCGFSFRVDTAQADFAKIYLPKEYWSFMIATATEAGAGVSPFSIFAQLVTDDNHMHGANWVKIADFTAGSGENVYVDISEPFIAVRASTDEDSALKRILDANSGSIRIGVGVDYSIWANDLSRLVQFLPTAVGVTVDLTESLDASVASIALKAYDPSESDGIRINALPFRAYEATCNAFFRNTQVDPFIVGGKKVYNKFNTTTAAGADTTPYELYKVNWEPDPFTTCMPTPMAGSVQPLVGMTKLGSVTITDENGVATTGTMQFTDDGETFTGGITITNPAASDENNRTLTQAAMAAAGMSIYDFRAANAFTRFLETTLRTGYKYYDFIRGHFGKGPKRAELDMPLFIGGTSQQITVSQVTQTSQGDSNNPLGSFAGQANCFGGSRHDVNFTADDYGWILGLIWIQPTPAYSQMLPKHFLAKDRFDYYFPEFANLGMQPVTLGEIAPLQAKLESKSLRSTFGYQRPNYDLVQFTDQVHGQFRASLKDMLINRLFPTVPELGEQFIKVQPEETSNIFAVNAPDEDNYIGQIVVDCKMKRPIPRVSIPSLGR